MTADRSVGAPPTGRPYPSLMEAVRVWTRIALLSFGGPAGQIALMHRVLVDEKRWLGDRRFLHALNFCMLLPGPEAQQLAIYVGWLLHRTLGGLIAGLLFVLPGLVAIMALSWVYVLYGDAAIVAGLFFGLKAAVLAIVVQAVIRIGRRALNDRVLIGIAAASFVAIFVFDVLFPAIVVASALIGLLAARLGTGFAGGAEKAAAGDVDARAPILPDEPADNDRRRIGPSVVAGVVALLLWLLPTAFLLVTVGADNVFSQIAVFFSQMAVVTFGGAYAVLAWVAQAAVDTYGWLTPGEMLDGLGMAETTPGPLIMVNQFVGFIGAFRDPGSLSPLVAATLGGLLATWVTFAPCFLWIFLGAPHIERLRRSRLLRSALAAVTASVVGVILNLAMWFGLHVLFAELRPAGLGIVTLDVPVLASIDPVAAVLTIGALVAILRFRVGVVATLGTCAVAGLILRLTGLAAI